MFFLEAPCFLQYPSSSRRVDVDEEHPQEYSSIHSFFLDFGLSLIISLLNRSILCSRPGIAELHILRILMPYVLHKEIDILNSVPHALCYVRTFESLQSQIENTALFIR